jgi:hypothetical protein
VHIKAVADLLGHSSISITGDIYGHTSDATTRAAIDGLTSILPLAATNLDPSRRLGRRPHRPVVVPTSRSRGTKFSARMGGCAILRVAGRRLHRRRSAGCFPTSAAIRPLCARVTPASNCTMCECALSALAPRNDEIHQTPGAHDS